MKLLACHIENFGKLTDFRMDFSDGINTVTEPNGWGKSTLAAFLKAMLYGFDSRREEGSPEKERKMYTPWQGGTFGGQLDIETGERRYRICRTFGLTEKTDTFALYDLDTNLPSSDYSANIGVELFDIDRASFRRTIYVAQNDCGAGTSDSINAKLGNLAAASNDINNYEKAMAALRERMNHLSPKRATGSLKKRVALIAQLRQEKKELDAAAGAMDTVKERLEEKQQQYQEILGIRAEYSKAMRMSAEDGHRKELLHSYERLFRDAEEKKARMEECAAAFPSGVPEEETFRQGRELIRQLEEQVADARHQQLNGENQSELAELEEQFAGQLPDMDSIEEMTEKAVRLSGLRHHKQQTEEEITTLEREAAAAQKEDRIDPHPVKSRLTMPGILLLAVGAAAVVFGLIGQKQGAGYALQVLILGILLLLTGVLLVGIGRKINLDNAADLAHRLEERDRRLQQKRQPLLQKQEEVKKDSGQIDGLEKELAGFMAPYPFIPSDVSWTERMYQIRSCRNRYQELKNRQIESIGTYQQIDSSSARLKALLESLGLGVSPDMAEELNQLQTKATEYRIAAEEYEKACSQVTAFEQENDMDSLKAPEECIYTMDELQEMMQEADENIEALRGIIGQYDRRLQDLQQQLDLRDDKEQELKVALRTQAQETREYEMLEKTQDFLRRSKEAFVARYMGPITGAFGKYYVMLTGDESENWMIDADLCLRLKEHGLMREIRWLSAGYRDLLGICMRMAVVDAMYPQEKPFLIFDDPFVNLDTRKVKNGLALLQKLGEEYQILYFTCHESRR